MSSSRIFTFVLFLLSFTLLSQAVLGVDPLFYTCPSSSGTYTVNGYTSQQYGINLNKLVGFLTLGAPPTGFSIGSVGKNPDQVYGLAQCRGDVSDTDCQACLAEASSEVHKLCPSSKAGTIWYDKCLLRYSNMDFFGRHIGNQVTFFKSRNESASDPGWFNQMTRELFRGLSEQAYVSPNMYAAGEMDLGYQSQKLSGFVVCTRDLSGADCKKCLEGAIELWLPRCCDGKVGGRVIRENCMIHYGIILGAQKREILGTQKNATADEPDMVPWCG